MTIIRYLPWLLRVAACQTIAQTVADLVHVIPGINILVCAWLRSPQWAGPPQPCTTYKSLLFTVISSTTLSDTVSRLPRMIILHHGIIHALRQRLLNCKYQAKCECVPQGRRYCSTVALNEGTVLCVCSALPGRAVPQILGGWHLLKFCQCRRPDQTEYF